jgi:phosphonate transport system ATP-binding protein
VNIAREYGEQFVGLKDGEVVFDGPREELTAGILEEIYGDIETDELREGTERTATTDATRRPDTGIESKP